MGVDIICPNGHSGSYGSFMNYYENYQKGYFFCPECNILFRSPNPFKGEIGVVVRKPTDSFGLSHGKEKEIIKGDPTNIEIKRFDAEQYVKQIRMRSNFVFEVCCLCKNLLCEINGGEKECRPYKDKDKILCCDGLEE